MFINKFKRNNPKKDFYCLNCGKNDHIFKNCKDPITSYGIILISLDGIDEKIKDIITQNMNVNHIIDKIDNSINNGIMIDNSKDIELFCQIKNYIKFLLIQRKHTLGFIEFIRGRYSIDNIDGIIFLFKQMTHNEINKIKICDFDTLWDEVWGENKNKVSYQVEYTLSKDKFNKLKNDDNGYLNLDFYLDNIVPSWETPEWGFPKGRRNMKENDIICALREFKEETNYKDSDITLLDKVQPIEEVFIGTNGITYKHIYYIAIAKTDKIPSVDINNKNQCHEIGDIKYLTYEDTIKAIRPYHLERQKLVTKLYIHVMNNIMQTVKNVEK